MWRLAGYLALAVAVIGLWIGIAAVVIHFVVKFW
jgi:hypothetical protein